MNKKKLEEQMIINKSPEAIAYRNIHRYKVDKLFSLRDKTNDDTKKKMFDFLARQKWRKIIKTSNEL